MAINATVPHWLQEANTGWLRTAERTGAHAISQGFDAGQKLAQNQQENLLKLRQLLLQREQLDAENKLRWQKLSEAEAETRDLTRLQQYAQDPDSGIPQFESPNSYSKLSAIDLALSRNELGRQLSFDRSDLNRRLSKVSAADRMAILEAKEKGLGSEVYSLLDQAEARQREKLASEKTFVPSDVRRLLSEANDAELGGNLDEAEILRKRARILAGEARESSVQGRMNEVDRYRLTDIRTRLNTVTRALADPKSVLRSEDEKAKLQQEKAELEKQQTGILTRYESPTPTGERPDVTAAREGRTFRVPVDGPGGLPIPPKVTNQADIDEAYRWGNEAIRNGKSREAVIARWREMGVPVAE